MKRCLLLIVIVLSINSVPILAATKIWNGSTSSSWTTDANWTPSGVPGILDSVVINNSSLPNQPYYDNSTIVNYRVGWLTITAGTLSLNNLPAYAITAVNSAMFSDCSISNGYISSYTFSEIKNVNFTAINLSKNGTTNDVLSGGNTFAGSCYISTIAALGGSLKLANTNSDNFTGDIIFRQSASCVILPAYNANSTFSGNITINGAGAMTMAGGTGRVTINGNPTQTLTNTGGSLTINRLTLNQASSSATSFTVTSAFSIGSDLTLTNGVVYLTGGNSVTLKNNATTTIGNANSYINGKMVYEMASMGPRTLNFPLGNGSFWRPIVQTFTHSNATLTTYTASLVQSSAVALNYTLPATLQYVSATHYWDFTRSAVSNFVSGVATLYYNSPDGVFDPNQLRVAKSNGTPNWTDIGGVGTAATTGSITSNSYSSFPNSVSNKFTLANVVNGGNPLPVDIISFTGTKFDPDHSRLVWQVANELKFNNYVVQRSQNPSTEYEDIKTIRGAKDNVYSYLDYTEGVAYYYRLKLVDKDGSFTYSEIIYINNDSKAIHFTIFKGSNDDYILTYVSEQEQEAILLLYDLSGKEMIKKSISLEKGYNAISIKELEQLLPAIYLANLVSENGVQSIKLVK